MSDTERWNGSVPFYLVLFLVACGLAPNSAFAQYDYPGRSSDAAWRSAAQNRIDSLRKATLEVSVVDESGTPVDGATVEVEMQEHAFNFGTAVSDGRINGDGTYRDTLRQRFNYATIETGLKYYNWAANPDRQESVHAAVDWLENRGYTVRGHAAWWEEWDWMQIDDSQSASQIHQEMKDKIQPRLTEFEGQMRDWDAQNHPFHRNAIRSKVANGTDMTEKQVVAEWWKVANEADQQARMGINEQNIIQKYPCCNWVSRYDSWIQDLLDREVEVEAIGFMGHANVNRLEGIPNVLSLFDRFEAFGLPLYVSEFHITLDDWQNETWSEASATEKDAQADYLRDFLTAFFSHPAADTFVHWTFWEGQAWRQTSALYGPDWTLRDHGQIYRDLVYDQWWTDEQGTTDGGGVYATRGFKGDYKITVTHDGPSRAVKARLRDEGTSVQITVGGRSSSYGPGGAASFDGRAGNETYPDHLRLPQPDAISDAGPYQKRTVELWFKADSVGSNTGKQVIYDEGGVFTGFNVLLQDGSLFAGVWNNLGGGGGWGFWNRTAEVEPNTWHHVALVFDGTEEESILRTYLDGQPFHNQETVGGGSVPLEMGAHSGGHGLGWVNTNSNFAIRPSANCQNSGYVCGSQTDYAGNGFRGQLDQVRLWNGRLSQDQIRSRARQTINTDAPVADSLILSYRFNEGSSGTLVTSSPVDASTNNFHVSKIEGDPEWRDAGMPNWIALTDGAGGRVGPPQGRAEVTVSTGTEDTLEVYSFGDPSAEPVLLESVDDAAARLEVVWGFQGIGTPAADVTFDVSGRDGVDLSNVVVLHRDDPESAWTDVSSNWTRDGAAFTQTGITRFGQYTIGGDADDLPVELAGFDGARIESGVRLTWRTASETNNTGFEVQRRVAETSDGGWSSVGFVESKVQGGTTEEPQTYRYADADLPPTSEVLTYRLKQIDLDGSASFSDPITIERGKVDELTLQAPYPNPAWSQVTVLFAVPEDQQGDQMTMQLYDALGRRVRAVQASVKPGRHTQQLAVSGLASGTYFLRLEVAGTVKTERLTVVR